jgi:hypothetical protein
MPEFETVSLEEAQVNTTSDRRRKFINGYTRYIRRLSQGQAGKLHPGENEKPATIRRRLVSAAQALDTKLIIKRSGEDVYFWKEDGAEEEPRPRRGRRRRHQEETIAPDQPMREPEFPTADNFNEQAARIEADLPSSTL